MRLAINTKEHWYDLVGQELGVSDYVSVTQDKINEFADATGDFQWIHTDPEKAARESPFKATIAHGYMTVAMIPTLLADIFSYENQITINYGIEKFKFGQAVVVNSEVRLRATAKAVKDLRGILRVTLHVVMEIKGERKPAFSGDVVFLYQ